MGLVFDKWYGIHCSLDISSVYLRYLIKSPFNKVNHYFGMASFS